MNSTNNKQLKHLRKAKTLLSLILAFALALTGTFALTGCSEKKNPSADVSKGIAGVEYYH